MNELAEELEEESKAFASGAKELADHHTGWVLAVPQVDDGIESQITFRKEEGLTLGATEAVQFDTYLDAVRGRSRFKTGEYYAPEPLAYHTRRQAERQNA